MNGHDNNICFDSDYKSLVFVGKATRITGSGMTYYPRDAASWVYFRNVWTGSTSFSYTGGVGVRTVQCTGCSNNTYGASATISDTQGYYTYSITCLTKPVIFTYSSAGPAVQVSVLSIVNSGTTSGGLPVWYIKVGLGYTAGLRESALPYVTIYCFSTIPNTATSNYGMAMYNSAGELSFDSNRYKALRIQDLITLNSVTFPSGQLSSFTMNLTTSSSPVNSLYSLAKPSFMNVDFGRYGVTTNLFLANLNRDQGYPQGCRNPAPISAHFNQPFLTGGMYLNGSVITATLHGIDLIGYACAEDAGTNTSINNNLTKTPTYIPVINGADYD